MYLVTNYNFLMNGVICTVNEDIVRYVNAASAGDTDAMAKLFSKTLKSSFYLAYRLCGNPTEAVEIVKNAYTRVFCTLSRLKKSEAFEIFMRQNIASVYKEGRTFTFGEAVADTPEGPLEFLSEDVYENDMKRAAVTDAVSDMSDELRSATVLHYYSGMPVTPLARYFGISESAVNSVLSKAKEIIFEKSGSEKPGVQKPGTLPVLNRIFKLEAESVSVNPADVRDIFSYVFEKYSAFKQVENTRNGAGSSGSAGGPAVPRSSGSGSDEPVGIDFDTFIDEPYAKKPVVKKGGFSLDIVKDFISNFNLKRDYRKLIIPAAALLILILLIAGISKAAGKKSNVSVDNTATEIVAEQVAAKWVPGGFEDCSEITYLNENMACFKSVTTQKYGIMDYTGKILIQPRYDTEFRACGTGRDYSNMGKYHVVIKIDNTDYYVSYSNGNAEIAGVHQSHSFEDDTFPANVKYDERDRYFEGYAAAEKNGKWGYVDFEGKKVIPYQYEAVNIVDGGLNALNKYNSDYCRPVTGGLVAVKRDGLMGIVNLKNEVIAEFEYSVIMPGKDGIFIAKKDGTWGVITTGNAVNTFTGVNYLLDTSDDEISTEAGQGDKYYVVIGSGGINIRADADKDAQKIGELSTGSRIKGQGTKVAANGNAWLRIEFNGRYGYVAMNLVREDTSSN